MGQSQQPRGLWGQLNLPRPPPDATDGRRLADMLASYWDDPAPGGLVEMAKSVVQGVRAPGRILSGAYTVMPEAPGNGRKPMNSARSARGSKCKLMHPRSRERLRWARCRVP
jgi:hypothetical protein